MKISKKAEEELIRLARSVNFKKDMEILNRRHTSPFMKDTTVDVDAFVEFLMQFSAFINHEQKPFRRIIDKDMRL